MATDHNRSIYKLENLLSALTMDHKVRDLCGTFNVQYVPSNEDEEQRLCMFALLGIALAHEKWEARPKPKGRPKGPSRKKEDQIVAEAIFIYAESNGYDYRARGLVAKVVRACENRGLLTRSVAADSSTNRKRIKALCDTIHAERTDISQPPPVGLLGALLNTGSGN